MEIEPDVLMKHLRNAYLEHLRKSYKQEGFKTYLEYGISSNLRVDFAARKKDKLVLYEIKTGPFSDRQRKLVRKIREYIEQNAPSAEFHLAILNPPPEKEISFEGLGSIIFNDIIEEGIPSELDTLSTHTNIDEVTDIEIDSINIDESNIYLSGNGQVGVILQYGSDSDRKHDDADESYESFPFTFNLTMNRAFQIEESEYEYDTDSLFE